MLALKKAYSECLVGPPSLLLEGLHQEAAARPTEADVAVRCRTEAAAVEPKQLTVELRQGQQAPLVSQQQRTAASDVRPGERESQLQCVNTIAQQSAPSKLCSFESFLTPISHFYEDRCVTCRYRLVSFVCLV